MDGRVQRKARRRRRKGSIKEELLFLKKK